jgi:glycosyltransferase involved in cell wall biosynthesis
MVRLSAVIITFNEEKNIGRCLDSLKGVADEIVVLDSFSTDRTESICREHGVRFIRHPFGGYIEQKNEALRLAQFDHILSLDADEALSPALRASILAIKQRWDLNAYSFNRLTWYCKRFMRYGGWYPDRKIRLFLRGTGAWGGENPHDRFLPSDPARVGHLRGDLLHYSYFSVSEHVRQMNRFTDIASEAAFRNGMRTGWFGLLFRPLIKFLRDYIFLAGFLDGYYGFIAARISAQANFLKYVKLYELQRKNAS